MESKKKFKFRKRDLMDGSFTSILSFLEKILKDYKPYLGSSFKEVIDIELENLKEFLIPILKALSDGRISVNKIEEVGDALRIYIHRRYLPKFPDTCYPNFEEDHPLSVALTIVDFLQGGEPKYIIFPEDASFFIEMLQAPPEKSLETNKKMYEFVDQFDANKRYREGDARGLFDRW